MPGFGNAIGIPFIRRKLSGLRARFRGDGTITAMLDPILRDLSADFVSNGTITAALETIKLLDADFSGEGTVTGELSDFVGLLDDYPNAAAAYSVRLLSSSYSGALLEIRRSSDNATKAFLPDSNNELSMSSEAVVGSQTLSAFIGSNDGFVVTWYDQSGNANDATQSTASAQPQIISSGSLITENGKPAVDFDGVDDLLDIGQSIDLYSLASEWSVFMDAKVIDYSLQSFQRIIFNDSSVSTPDIPFGIQLRDNNDVAFFNNANVDTLTLSSATQRTLFSFIKRSSDVGIGINSVFTTGTKGGTDFTTGLENTTIGCSPNGSNRPAKMKSAEIVIYSSDQSSNRTGIETNINDFFSIY